MLGYSHFDKHNAMALSFIASPSFPLHQHCPSSPLPKHLPHLYLASFMDCLLLLRPAGPLPSLPCPLPFPPRLLACITPGDYSRRGRGPAGRRECQLPIPGLITADAVLPSCLSAYLYLLTCCKHPTTGRPANWLRAPLANLLKLPRTGMKHPANRRASAAKLWVG